MVLGSGAGGIVTVTSPILSPVTEATASAAAPPSAATSDMHLLDMDSQQRFIDQQHIHQQQQLQQQQLQLQQLQQHNLMPVSNSELDMNQINSAELRSLLATDADMTGPFVEAHLSENLSSNLNIIDPNPAMPPASSAGISLNNNLDQPMATSTAFLPNILGSAAAGAGPADSVHLKVANISSFCDTLTTPTPSSDSLTNLKSELEFLNNS